MNPLDFYELTKWKCFHHGFPLSRFVVYCLILQINLITMPNAYVVSYIVIVGRKLWYHASFISVCNHILFFYCLATFIEKRKMYLPKWIILKDVINLVVYKWCCHALITNAVVKCRWWWPSLLTSIISHLLCHKASQLKGSWTRYCLHMLVHKIWMSI